MITGPTPMLTISVLSVLGSGVAATEALSLESPLPPEG
jgi:hypothetical protein